MEIEIGKNLKSVLMLMARECPEEIKHLSPINILENFLGNDHVDSFSWELTKSEGGDCIDIRLRKIRKK